LASLAERNQASQPERSLLGLNSRSGKLGQSGETTGSLANNGSTEERDHAVTRKGVRSGAGLLLGLARPLKRQFLIIGDDNKLPWDDTGKPVFTEPGKDEVLIVDIKNRQSPTIVPYLS
jgi:hypothetical protein